MDGEVRSKALELGAPFRRREMARHSPRDKGGLSVRANPSPQQHRLNIDQKPFRSCHHHRIFFATNSKSLPYQGIAVSFSLLRDFPVRKTDKANIFVVRMLLWQYLLSHGWTFDTALDTDYSLPPYLHRQTCFFLITGSVGKDATTFHTAQVYFKDAKTCCGRGSFVSWRLERSRTRPGVVGCVQLHPSWGIV